MRMGIKKPSRLEGFWRFRADSNRCRRFCRPLPSHSATKPINWDANLAFFNKGAKFWVKKLVDSGQWTVVSCQLSVDSRQLSVDSRQLSVSGSR